MKTRVCNTRMLIAFSFFILFTLIQTASCIGQDNVDIKQLTKVSRGLIGLGMVDMAERGANKFLTDNPSAKDDPDFYILLATIYNYKKDFEKSSALLQKAAELCTSTACLYNAQIAMAEGLYLSGSYDQVGNAIDKFLETNPDEPNPWYFSGASKYLLNQFASAVPYLENAYNKRSNDSLFLWETSCLEMLSQSFIQVKKYSDSEKYLTILLASGVKDSVKLSWYNHMLGRVYSEQGSYDKSIQALDNAIAIYPDNAEIYPDLAKAYIKKGNKAKADEVMNGMVKKLPASPEAYYQLGFYQLTNNNPVGASANIDKAIALDPTNPKYPAAASMAYEDIKDYNKAIQYCMKAVMIDPTNLWSNHNLGYLYALNKQWDQAIEWENKALAINPRYYLANSVLAWAYLEKNQCDKTMEYSRVAIQASQNDDGAFDMPYYYMGVCLEKAGEKDRAIGFYRVAAAIGNPEAKEKLKLLGYTFNPLSTWAEPAQEYYTKASEMEDAQNFTEAQKYLDLATELAPNKDLVLDFRILLWIKQKDFDKALAEANKSLEILPQSDRVNTTTGYLYYLRGDKDNCFKHLSIGASYNYETAINYLYSIGWQYYKVEDYANTAKFLAESSKYKNLDGDDLYAIGYCYHMSNDLITATQFYIKAAQAGNASAQTILRDSGISW